MNNMSRSLKLCYVFIDTFDYSTPDREYLDHKDLNELKDWISNNPLPKNEIYEDIKEVYDDLTKSSGIITFESKTNIELVNWMNIFLEELFD